MVGTSDGAAITSSVVICSGTAAEGVVASSGPHAPEHEHASGHQNGGNGVTRDSPHIAADALFGLLEVIMATVGHHAVTQRLHHRRSRANTAPEWSPFLRCAVTPQYVAVDPYEVLGMQGEPAFGIASGLTSF
jgi:hypothetical protein